MKKNNTSFSTTKLFLLRIFFLFLSFFSNSHFLESTPRSKIIADKTNRPFSGTLSRFLQSKDYNEKNNTFMWHATTPYPFKELIVSWNAQRPQHGYIDFFTRVKHAGVWSPWQKLASWGAKTQKTFHSTTNEFVHTKHVRIEMQKGRLGREFGIKVVCHAGAQKRHLKALFACFSHEKHLQKAEDHYNQPSLYIKNIPQQSQMVLNHERARDLCSPTSISMMLYYLNQKYLKRDSVNDLSRFVPVFAEQVHDDSHLDIYGNWLFNVAQAFDSSRGYIYYRVQRLNNFHELYSYLKRGLPIAVSVRNLKGGATPYAHGHFMLIVGWNRKTQRIICMDPAFKDHKKVLRSYSIHNFLTAWRLSRNLSYIPIPAQNKIVTS